MHCSNCPVAKTKNDLTNLDKDNVGAFGCTIDSFVRIAYLFAADITNAKIINKLELMWIRIPQYPVAQENILIQYKSFFEKALLAT